MLSREQLLSHVWGYEFDPGSNVVDVYVGYLRKKLGYKLITTVRGSGYRFGWYRELQLLRIYEGTDEIRRRTIGRNLLRGHASIRCIL